MNLTSNLTDGMFRLCDEIVALRDQRATLCSNLAHDRQDRKEHVSQMCTDLRAAQEEMARDTRAERESFITKVRDTVTGLRQEVRVFRRDLSDDLQGARRAWRGRFTLPVHRTSAAEQTLRETAPRTKKKKR